MKKLIYTILFILNWCNLFLIVSCCDSGTLSCTQTIISGGLALVLITITGIRAGLLTNNRKVRYNDKGVRK